MKKIMMVLCLMMTSMYAYAGLGNIITPDAAISMWSTPNFTYDKDMNILICPRNAGYSPPLTANSSPTCVDKDNKSVWVTMANSVPKGKTFVGFTVLNDRVQYITIYWK